jgi:replicative DNA helicase
MNRVPDEIAPHNVEAEKAVLGALQIDPGTIHLVKDFLRSSDFYIERHQWIYEAVCTLTEGRTAVDQVTLCDELERKERLAELGGAAYLTAVVNATPTSLNIEHYAHIVERTARDRMLISAGLEIAELGRDEATDPDEKEARAQQILLDGTSRGSSSIVAIRDVGSRYYDHVAEMRERGAELLGPSTGIPTLDKMLKGLQPSRQYVLAGRPGMGKTGLALGIAMNVAEAGGHVGVFSLEMNDLQLFNRWVAAATDIDSQRLMTGQLRDDEWAPFTHAVEAISQRPIYIDDSPMLGISALRSKAKRIYLQHGLNLVVVDYLQLMDGENDGRRENREREISRISWGTKVLARELEIPVLVVCQLNRGVEQRKDKHPMLSDLRESGSLEQNADGVILIYRDEYYNPNTEYPNIAELDVAKQRDGPTGRIPLLFKKETVTFREAKLIREDLNAGYTPPPPDESREDLIF